MTSMQLNESTTLQRNQQQESWHFNNYRHKLCAVIYCCMYAFGCLSRHRLTSCIHNRPPRLQAAIDSPDMFSKGSRHKCTHHAASHQPAEYFDKCQLVQTKTCLLLANCQCQGNPAAAYKAALELATTQHLVLSKALLLQPHTP